jgi:hypothetical protein
MDIKLKRVIKNKIAGDFMVTSFGDLISRIRIQVLPRSQNLVELGIKGSASRLGELAQGGQAGRGE